MALTDQEWKDAYEFAKKKAYSLGARDEKMEDIAATAMEKLVKQDPKPDNIEAWLTTVIKNYYFDLRKKKHPDGGSWNNYKSNLVSVIDKISNLLRNQDSLGSKIAKNLEDKEKIRKFMHELEDKERQILEMYMADVSNEEIAQKLGYQSGKVVATKIGQIIKKIRKNHSIDF